MFFSYCKSEKKNLCFEVKNFEPISNLSEAVPLTVKTKTLTLPLDYTDALRTGFIIPSSNQSPDGYFHLKFQIKNLSQKAQKFYYKIYYQAETYKFPEYKENIKNVEHNLAYENFYGSWEDTGKTFDSTSVIFPGSDFQTIESLFRIAGNPRNEIKYYGGEDSWSEMINEDEINKQINEIRQSGEWYADIVSKAKKNGITTEKQLYKDAIYIIKVKRQQGETNNRWKRNPRVGNYSFMLVVTTKEKLQLIPSYIQNISLKNGEAFNNPYHYFLYGKGANAADVYVEKKDSLLRVYAKPDLTAGIFANLDEFNCDQIIGNQSTSTATLGCSSDSSALINACFKQFLSYINPDFVFHNIPLVADVTSGDYTKEMYKKSLMTYQKKDLLTLPQKVASCPCKTVGYDSKSNNIFITNPGNKAGEMYKENSGIITRHGLTYGKFRAKVKMPRLLNKNKVWNGLTNALWLINQEDFGNWNSRRNCNAGDGFIPKHLDGQKAKRVRSLSYSEIDFEIVKCNRYWPERYYGKSAPKESAADADNIVVTCTNWDLACTQPKSFQENIGKVKFNKQSFETFRWDKYYKALTIKTPAPDEELFGLSFYYFEIEWKPDEIIWRIGPAKDKMRVVGYMNDKITSIPNNQMLFIITQEFHLEWWWPEAPFNQDYIPFPAKDITGYFYELEIE